MKIEKINILNLDEETDKLTIEFWSKLIQFTNDYNHEIEHRKIEQKIDIIVTGSIAYNAFIIESTIKMVEPQKRQEFIRHVKTMFLDYLEKIESENINNQTKIQ